MTSDSTIPGPDPAPQQPPEMAEPIDIDLKNITAIVVEDEEVISDVICALLGKIGLRRAIAVGNAEDAIYQLEDDETTKIDIALVDLMLPGASGLALIKTMREHKTRRLREMPVVVITSYTGMKVYRKAAEFDINGFLRKPVSPGSLETAVIRALGGKVSAKAMQAYRNEAGALQREGGGKKNTGFLAWLFGADGANSGTAAAGKVSGKGQANAKPQNKDRPTTTSAQSSGGAKRKAKPTVNRSA